jgi:hypothetical protein
MPTISFAYNLLLRINPLSVKAAITLARIVLACTGGVLLLGCT